jgi:hypothetical protein
VARLSGGSGIRTTDGKLKRPSPMTQLQPALGARVHPKTIAAEHARLLRGLTSTERIHKLQ